MSDELHPLIAALLGPDEAELTCEECFDQLDRYVEAERAGSPADLLVPGMRAHLAGCPACREDHASLAEFLARQSPPA